MAGTITGTALIGAGTHGLGQAGASAGAGVTHIMAAITDGVIHTTAGAITITITAAITIITRIILMPTTMGAEVTTTTADVATMRMVHAHTRPVQEVILILRHREPTAHHVRQPAHALKPRRLASTTITITPILHRAPLRQRALTHRAVRAEHEAAAIAAAVQVAEVMAAVHAAAEEDNSRKT